MARFTIIGQRPDTEVVGGANTRPVQVIEVVTGRHAIYFEARLPRQQATTKNLQGLALANAVMLDALNDLPGVDTVEWTQEATDAGQLEDHAILYVVSDSGFSTGVLDFAFDQITDEYVDPRVAALRAALNNTESEG